MSSPRRISIITGFCLLALAALGWDQTWGQTSPTNYQVFAFNDLGMHCYDNDFSVFAVLPPYNVVHGQVVLKGRNPKLLDLTGVHLTYQAVADPLGSINRTSNGKTNFWSYVQKLFGASLAVDTGLKGFKMPGSANTPQAMTTYEPTTRWFAAEGIPITAFDDAKKRNTLPLMRVSARNNAGAVLSSVDTVVPASDEMNCSNCHTKGQQAANAATAAKFGISGWSASANSAVQVKENILILHDGAHKTTLMANKPVLCASCHYSPALDLSHAGPQGAQLSHEFFSHAMHTRHGKTVGGSLPDAAHPAIIGDGLNACYLCHPGATTKCLRGAMATAGESCQNCHGGMLAVGGVHNLATGKQRTPWLDEPKCQSCHTGDALNHLGADLIQHTAFDANDPAATPRIAINKRFAENDNTLYRFSTGHGGMACESCHGSTHAEWPARAGANDNIAAIQIQGHAGPIIECASCHGAGLPLTTNGPHGLHNVNNPSWNLEHGDYYEKTRNNCKACHGVNLEGTALSRAAVDRSLFGPDRRTVTVAKGTAITCTTCHQRP